MKKLFLAIFTLLFAIGSLNAGAIKIPVAFKANFIQQVKNPKGKVIKYKGSVIFNSPSSTKWNYTSPTKKEVCSQGKQVIVIDHDLEQVNYYSVKKGFNLAKVLSNAKLHHANVYTTEFDGKLYTIVLNAKKQIEQIAYKDNLDNIVNIIFVNIQYRNRKFPMPRFECIKPRNYDSIY